MDIRSLQRRVKQKNCEYRHHCQFKYGVCQWPFARQAHQRKVKPAHKPHDVGSVRSLACGLFIGHQRPQSCDSSGAAPGYQATYQRWFKQPTRIENLKGLLKRWAGHECAAVGYHFHDAVVGQTGQRVTDLRQVSGEQLSQPVFDELGARRQSVFKHRMPTTVEDGLANGGAIQWWGYCNWSERLHHSVANANLAPGVHQFLKTVA